LAESIRSHLLADGLLETVLIENDRRSFLILIRLLVLNLFRGLYTQMFWRSSKLS
jgi:hypothetical protein